MRARLALLFVAMTLLFSAHVARAADSAGASGSGNSMMQQDGQNQSSGNQQGGNQQMPSYQSNAPASDGKSSFKTVVQHDPNRKVIGNGAAYDRPVAKAIDPTAKPVRSAEEMVEHNRGVINCVSICWTSYQRWLKQCIAANNGFPCGSQGEDWYYRCQHGCVNGK